MLTRNVVVGDKVEYICRDSLSHLYKGILTVKLQDDREVVYRNNGTDFLYVNSWKEDFKLIIINNVIGGKLV